jgi:hypothetical protein
VEPRPGVCTKLARMVRGHDRESEARGTGWELTFKRVLPDMEGCEGIWTNMEGGVLMQRNEAERDDHRGRKLN